MLDRSVIVIGAGPLPELLMAEGCNTLAKAVGVPLRTVNVDSPRSMAQQPGGLNSRSGSTLR